MQTTSDYFWATFSTHFIDWKDFLICDLLQKAFSFWQQNVYENAGKVFCVFSEYLWPSKHWRSYQGETNFNKSPEKSNSVFKAHVCLCWNWILKINDAEGTRRVDIRQAESWQRAKHAKLHYGLLQTKKSWSWVLNRQDLTSGLLLGRSEVLRSLRHYLQTQSQDHHTIDRLEERGVERGSARRSSLKGRERAIVNQTKIGLLGKLLRDGIWDFPSAQIPSWTELNQDHNVCCPRYLTVGWQRGRRRT